MRKIQLFISVGFSFLFIINIFMIKNTKEEINQNMYHIPHDLVTNSLKYYIENENYKICLDQDKFEDNMTKYFDLHFKKYIVNDIVFKYFSLINGEYKIDTSQYKMNCQIMVDFKINYFYNYQLYKVFMVN